MILREQKYAHHQIGSFFQVDVNKNRCLKPQPSFSYIPISILLWCPIGTGFHLFHPIPSEKVLGPTFTPPGRLGLWPWMGVQTTTTSRYLVDFGRPQIARMGLDTEKCLFKASGS